MRMDNFRIQRNMPFVKRGMRVKSTYSGKSGRISGVNNSENLNVIFDGEKHISNCHPTWMMQYLNSDGVVIAEYSAK